MKDTFQQGLRVLLGAAAGALLMLAATADHPLSMTPVGLAGDPALLGPASPWTPPLARRLGANVGAVPAAVHAAAASLVLTLLLAPALKRSPLAIGALLFALLLAERGFEQGVLVAGACRLLFESSAGSTLSQRRIRFGLLAAWSCAALLSSIEFGLVLMLAALIWLSHPQVGMRWWVARLGVAAGLGFGLWFGLRVWDPTLAATLLRPVAWIADPSLPLTFPRIGPIWSVDLAVPDVLLSALLVAGLWALCRRRSEDLRLLAPVGLFSALGVCCIYYLPAAAAVAAMGAALSDRSETAQPLRPRLRQAVVTLLYAALVGYELFWNGWRWMGASEAAARPQSWSEPGNVLLMDRDDARYWRRPGRENLTLVADDRWEFSQPSSAEYAATWRDLSSFRPETYRRTDDERGGYAQAMKQWSPSLLAVPTSDAMTIRRLSLNPQCRLFTMDQQRTLFVWIDDPRWARRSAEAAGHWKALEWAGPLAEVQKSILHLEGRASRLAVAESLCAARLPYSCLRVLPGDNLPWTNRLRGLAYLEIAHRESIHAGEASLLNLARGAARVKRAEAWPIWSNAQRLRVAAALASVGLQDQAELIVRPMTELPRRWFLAGEDLQSARLLLPSQRKTRPNGAEIDPATAAWRSHLLAGDVSAARQALPEIEGNKREYYEWLTEAVEQPADAAARSLLERLLANPNWPADFLARAWYELGSLGLETGDRALAQRAFQRSAAMAPGADFAEIRDLHLRMLAGSADR